MDVEVYVKGFQVLILFPAQIGYGELADGREVVGIAPAGDRAVLGLDDLARHVGAGDIADVFTPIAILRPAWMIGPQAPGAGLHRAGQVVDLGPGIVVVELPGDLPARRAQQAAEAVAYRCAAAVADVEGPGGGGRDKLHLQLAGAPLLILPLGIVAVARALLEDVGDDCGLGRPRSEERRVGKECRSRWGPDDEKKKRKNTGDESERTKCSIHGVHRE